MHAFLPIWGYFREQSIRYLKPGVWLECQEQNVDVHSDDESLPEDSHIRKRCSNEEAAWSKIGLTVSLTGEEVMFWMENAGFANITVQECGLPVVTWSADPKLRETGGIQLVAMMEGLQGLTIAPWVHHLGWKADEVKSFVRKG